MIKDTKDLADNIKYNISTFLEQCQSGISLSNDVYQTGLLLRTLNEKLDNYLDSLDTYESYYALYGLLQTHMIEVLRQQYNSNEEYKEYKIEYLYLSDANMNLKRKESKVLSFSFNAYIRTDLVNKDKKIILTKQKNVSHMKIRDILCYLFAKKFTLVKKDEILEKYEIR